MLLRAVECLLATAKEDHNNDQVDDGTAGTRNWHGDRDDGNRSRAKWLLVGWLQS